MFLFNSIGIKRFSMIYELNLLFYFLTFILMGLETILLKDLVDNKYINIFIILGIKGILGTIVALIINVLFKNVEFFNILDHLLDFEYDDIYEEFDLYLQIIYVITQIIVQYLKIYIINKFTETHFLYCIMITDILYFPFYCIERLFIQKFIINIPELFFSNLIVATISFILFLIINEIVECNFWNCSFDIRNKISQRQFYETLSENAIN